MPREIYSGDPSWLISDIADQLELPPECMSSSLHSSSNACPSKFFGRKHFDNFDASSVARYDKKKLLLLKVRGSLLLSEPKLRAVVENAKQIVKVLAVLD